jgi:outer membrane protein OmpA-like peptidoglycan-associated protein
MKKQVLSIVFCLLVIFASSSIKAQTFTGLHASTFGGVSNVSYNPAIADNHFKFDMNIIGVNAKATNNYMGLNRTPLFKPDSFNASDFNNKFLKERLNGKDKKAYVGATVQGPLSFLFSWGKDRSNKNAIAFTYNINTVVSAGGINQPLARNMFWGFGKKGDSIQNYKGTSFDASNTFVNVASWLDVGLTYSRVVYNKGNNFVSVGGTLKYVQGLAGLHLEVDEFNMKYETEDSATISKAKGSLYHTDISSIVDGDVTASSLFKNAVPTVAVDLGMRYEYRPKQDDYKYDMDCKSWYKLYQDRYKFAVGFSIIDIGKVTFKNNPLSGDFTSNDANTLRGSNTYFWDIPATKLNDLASIDSLSFTRLNQTSKPDKFSLWLPTTYNVYFDYHIWKGFGVNASATISANMSGSKNMLNRPTVFSVTPKYDHAWFGAYLPISYDLYGNFQSGLGLRLGPVTVGSSDLFGTLLKKNRFNIDIYLALKVGIPYKRQADRDKDFMSNKVDKCKREKGTCESGGCPDKDGDGIVDVDDKCPDVKGPKELSGCPDKDGDGIADKDDKCPDVKGIKLFAGCPDTDGDGIQDSEDDCPTQKGLKEFKGCPDTDGDGISDNIDKCPTVKGLKEFEGCPDRDGDGIQDSEDACPDVKGLKEFKGCPDTDGDGLADNEDNCPNVAGPKSNKGCPEIKKEVIEKVKKAAQGIYFETGKDIIKPVSFKSLDNVVSLLNADNSLKVDIDGHTDNVGDDAKNMDLSNRRAAAVKNYFVKKGIDVSRLVSTGYGETKPVSENTTTTGRALNRRVELNLRNY